MEHTDDHNHTLTSKQFRVAPEQLAVLKSSFTDQFLIVEFHKYYIDVYTHSTTPVFLFRQQFNYPCGLQLMFFEYNSNTKTTSFISYRTEAEVMIAGYIKILEDSIVIKETHSEKSNETKLAHRTQEYIFQRQNETHLIISETEIIFYLFRDTITQIEYDPTSNIFEQSDYDLEQEEAIFFFQTENNDVVGILCSSIKYGNYTDRLEEECNCLRVGDPKISYPHLYTFAFIDTKIKNYCPFQYHEDNPNDCLTSFLCPSENILYVIQDTTHKQLFYLCFWNRIYTMSIENLIQTNIDIQNEKTIKSKFDKETNIQITGKENNPHIKSRELDRINIYKVIKAVYIRKDEYLLIDEDNFVYYLDTNNTKSLRLLIEADMKGLNGLRYVEELYRDKEHILLHFQGNNSDAKTFQIPLNDVLNVNRWVIKRVVSAKCVDKIEHIEKINKTIVCIGNTVYLLNKKLVATNNYENKRHFYEEIFTERLTNKLEIIQTLKLGEDSINDNQLNVTKESDVWAIKKKGTNLLLYYKEDGIEHIKKLQTINSVLNLFTPIDWLITGNKLFILEQNAGYFFGTIIPTKKEITLGHAQFNNSLWIYKSPIVSTRFIQLKEDTVISVLLTENNIKVVLIFKTEITDSKLFLFNHRDNDEDDKKTRILKLNEYNIQIDYLGGVYLLFVNKNNRMKFRECHGLNEVVDYSIDKVYELNPIINLDYRNKTTYHFCEHLMAIFYYDKKLKMKCFEKLEEDEYEYVGEEGLDNLRFLKCYHKDGKHILIGTLDDYNNHEDGDEGEGEQITFVIERYTNCYQMKTVVTEMEELEFASDAILFGSDNLVIIDWGDIKLYKMENGKISLKSSLSEYIESKECVHMLTEIYQDEEFCEYEEGNYDEGFTRLEWRKLVEFRGTVVTMFHKETVAILPFKNDKPNLLKYINLEGFVLDMQIYDDLLYIVLSYCEHIRVLSTVNRKTRETIEIGEWMRKIFRKNGKIRVITDKGSIVKVTMK
eukprot:GAHX01000712.1.p1 GENE.GAHX01000712.1~~GAHX01000712.1.p1  ORF type:complete len:997 (-),score=190.70 GAHX01000712.1:42-3032(-)